MLLVHTVILNYQYRGEKMRLCDTCLKKGKFVLATHSKSDMDFCEHHLHCVY